MKAYWTVELQFHAFFTSALNGDEWSASRSGRFTPRESRWYTFDRRPSGPLIL